MTANQQADSSQVAAGQAYPGDWTDESTIAFFYIRQKIAQLETTTPVQVVAVHAGDGSPPAAGTVDVQLLVSLLDGNGNAQKQGIVYGVPYFRLQGGPWAIICDPAKDDFGFITACSRDISNFLANPGQVNPGSYRKFSFSDGIYFGGFSNQVPQATMWLKNDGTFKLTTKDNVVLQSDGSGNLVGSGTALKWTGDINVTGNITATQEITAKSGSPSTKITLSQHVHSANNTPPTPGH